MSGNKDVHDDKAAAFTLKVELLLKRAFAHGLGRVARFSKKNTKHSKIMMAIKFGC